MDSSGVSYYSNIDLSTTNVGCGIGMSTTFHLVDALYFIWNNSLMVLEVREKVRGNINIPYTMLALFQYKKATQRMYMYGGTTAVNLAYVTPAKITIALGGRYQIIQYTNGVKSSVLPSPENSYNIFKGEIDHFFGVTLAAILSLKL